MKNQGLKKTYSLILFLIITSICFAQYGNLNSEALYAKAKTEAFTNNNYNEAIRLMTMATQKSPNDTDLNIFLGRLYTWTKDTNKARAILKTTFEKHPNYEDAVLAFANLEYWDNHPKSALEIVNTGLIHNPNAENLLILKGKIQRDLKDYSAANTTLNTVLSLNPKSTEARAILGSLGLESSKNEIGLYYDFTYFDKQFENPWHLATVDYTRQTKLGALTARINYANRFNQGSTQFEIDLYPRISNTFYAYINGGISTDKGIFPEYRTGFSLYANLPAAFEIDAGFRLLAFNSNTWTYTASLGKYYKNFWFNFRTYLTPTNKDIANSYNFSTRYYFGGTDDYFGVSLGTGFSPDNSNNNILINNTTQLNSTNISLRFRKLVSKKNVVFLQSSFENIDYATNSNGNQYSIKLGYILRF